jgi:la-related protein 1
MPVTQVQGLDFLRICLLGQVSQRFCQSTNSQVEYYFGMQNLAMDFFLRQQMDSEGWIDISMISSFNRVKSLTPDVALVREMMLLSSVLEVKENYVRLAGGEAKRWVLPDARLSTIQSDNDEPTIENGGEALLGVPEDDAHERWSTPNGGVESALLKSVPVSSSVSVDDSDAVKEDTPATSMSGDHDNREEMEMKTIGAAVDALTAQQ